MGCDTAHLLLVRYVVTKGLSDVQGRKMAQTMMRNSVLFGSIEGGKRRPEVCGMPFTGSRESRNVLLELRGYMVEQETPRAPGVHGLELRVLSSEANQRTELRT